MKNPMGVWIATGALGRVRFARPPALETTMGKLAADRTDASTAIQTNLPAVFASSGTQPIYLALAPSP